MFNLPLPLPLLATSTQDRINWEIQNGFRRTGEWFEWQWEQLSRRNDLEIQPPPSWFDSLLLGLVRGLGILILLILATWGIRRLIAWWRRRRALAASAVEGNTQNLSPQWHIDDWLALARQAQVQEDYAEACRALYMALLLRFEQTGYVLRSPAFTDGEYLQTLSSLWALKAKPLPLQTAWRQIFLTHEQSYYGAQPVTAQTYHDCERAYQTLVPQLRSSTSPP